LLKKQSTHHARLNDFTHKRWESIVVEWNKVYRETNFWHANATKRSKITEIWTRNRPYQWQVEDWRWSFNSIMHCWVIMREIRVCIKVACGSLCYNWNLVLVILGCEINAKKIEFWFWVRIFDAKAYKFLNWSRFCVFFSVP
jgi:hypothetical protein